MTSDNILKDMFSDNASKRHLTTFLVFTMVLVIYHAIVFWVIMADEITAKDETDIFQITFDENSHLDESMRTIDDGDRETITFDVPDEMFTENDGFGILLINIAYGETSGQQGDSCDTITADLEPNSVKADWQNENNVLSGLSTDCSTISLMLHVYPGFVGEDHQAFGMDELHWSNLWKDDSHGQGVFELEVEVDTSQPIGSVIPGISDDDEEVTVTWEAVFFDVLVEQIN
jgi:hypothetical protein